MLSFKSPEPTLFEYTNFDSLKLYPADFDLTDFDYANFDCLDLGTTGFDDSPKPNSILFVPTVKSTFRPRIFNIGGLTIGVDMTT
jgi:hypothetical protein